MRAFLKKTGVSLLILAISMIVGLILLVLVYLLPTDIMREHVSESILMQVWEWDYYDWIPKDATSVSDGYTDALILNMAIHGGENGAVTDALLIPSSWYDGLDCMSEALQKYVSGDLEGSHIGAYPRYWHGYLIFLKPLLLFFNYYRIRWINTLVGGIAISAILLLLYKRFKSCKYSVAFLLSVLFLNPIVMRASLQFSLVFYVIVAEYIVGLIWGDKLFREEYYGQFFLISGIMTSFFTLLSYPFATLGMLLVLQLMFRNDSFIKNIFKAVKSSIMWGIGYAGMFVGKWVITELITGEPVISDAIHQIIYRSAPEVVEVDGVFTWSGLFERQFSWMSGENAILFKMALIMFIAGVVMLLATKRAKIEIKASQFWVFLLLSLFPIVRYIVLANHSFVHSMTYREQITAVMALSCAVLSSLKVREDMPSGTVETSSATCNSSPNKVL